jgi:hypothetical protein
MRVALLVGLAVALAVSSLTGALMAFEINEKNPEGPKLQGWGQATSEVYLQYSEQFPESRLPLVGTVSFRLSVLLVVLVLVHAMFTI